MGQHAEEGEETAEEGGQKRYFAEKGFDYVANWGKVSRNLSSYSALPLGPP